VTFSLLDIICKEIISLHTYNGDSSEQDFILSTHSIIRECDSENELKGSASTSLMKSIIGQSQVAGPRNQNLTGISQMGECKSLFNPIFAFGFIELWEYALFNVSKAAI
jgi:hypothetical protein